MYGGRRRNLRAVRKGGHRLSWDWKDNRGRKVPRDPWGRPKPRRGRECSGPFIPWMQFNSAPETFLAGQGRPDSHSPIQGGTPVVRGQDHPGRLSCSFEHISLIKECID